MGLYRFWISIRLACPIPVDLQQQCSAHQVAHAIWTTALALAPSFGCPGTLDWPLDWPWNPGLVWVSWADPSTVIGPGPLVWPWPPGLALAPCIGPGTLDWPWHPEIVVHPGLALSPWTGLHLGLALAPWTGPGTLNAAQTGPGIRLALASCPRRMRHYCLLPTG